MNESPVSGISGAGLIENFLTPKLESLMMERIEEGEWNFVRERWIQQYGWRYDFRHRSISAGDSLESPKFVSWLWEQLSSMELVNANYALVESYAPNDEGSLDIRGNCFAPTACVLALGGARDYELYLGESSRIVTVSRCSLLVLRGRVEFCRHPMDSISNESKRHLSVTCRPVREILL